MKNNRVILPLYYLVQLTWGSIQNALGLFLMLFLFIIDPRRERGFFFGSFVCRWKLRSSMSLGIFIFLGENNRHVLVHEYGHSIQSCILGPFYLPLIGLPSALWANLPRFRRQRRRGRYKYSSFYTERWANYLGRKYTRMEPISH